MDQLNDRRTKSCLLVIHSQITETNNSGEVYSCVIEYKYDILAVTPKLIRNKRTKFITKKVVWRASDRQNKKRKKNRQNMSFSFAKKKSFE